jgi:hypothetical protein
MARYANDVDDYRFAKATLRERYFIRFGWRLPTAGYANERHEFKASYINSFKINWHRHEITQPIDRQ